MIGVKGPCTPYALRREFLDSPSQYWSASSGAVYPLVLRLEERGLIRLKGKTADGREGNIYMLTRAGQRALTRWIKSIDAPACISVPPDPLRSRIAFLDLLDAADRGKCLENASSALRAYVSQVRSYTARATKEQTPAEYLVSLGALRTLEARLQWLEEVVQAIVD